MQTARTISRSRLPFDPTAVFSALERTISQADTSTYPPFNILKDEDHKFSVELALAGFSETDISVEVENGSLTVSADTSDAGEESRQFLHRGIARRGFKRTFMLGEHMQVREASMQNGILRIEITREIPEEKKPRKLEIKRLN